MGILVIAKSLSNEADELEHSIGPTKEKIRYRLRQALELYMEYLNSKDRKLDREFIYTFMGLLEFCQDNNVSISITCCCLLNNLQPWMINGNRWIMTEKEYEWVCKMSGRNEKDI